MLPDVNSFPPPCRQILRPFWPHTKKGVWMIPWKVFDSNNLLNGSTQIEFHHNVFLPMIENLLFSSKSKWTRLRLQWPNFVILALSSSQLFRIFHNSSRFLLSNCYKSFNKFWTLENFRTIEWNFLFKWYSDFNLFTFTFHLLRAVKSLYLETLWTHLQNSCIVGNCCKALLNVRPAYRAK